jgi:hypothetical protein
LDTSVSDPSISSQSPSLNASFCHNITQLQDDIFQETKNLENIVHRSRHYYYEIKSKHQLGWEVPAGFHASSALQQKFRNFTSPRRSKSYTNILENSHTIDINVLSSFIEPALDNENTLESMSPFNLPSTTMSIHDTSNAPIHAPIIRSIDKVSSSLPNKISMSEDCIRSSVGFCRIDTLKRQFSTLYTNNVTIDATPMDAILDAGDLVTMRKKDRNTQPVSRPLHFGEIFHIDIVFGPEVSIGNIHYGLLFTDHFSRLMDIYPLQNLTTDIKKQMETFFAHIGIIPKRIISDFDTKLIGGQAREYLNSLLIHVNPAPSYRQDKNGLVERH